MIILNAGHILPRSFYTRSDVVVIARELLGKHLVTLSDGVLTSGLICETEAYAGVDDRASHAFGGRNTDRTRIMYMQGGTAYVYLCYGIHSLFNVVTHEAGIPHAVLVRGIVPVEGIQTMLTRTGKSLPAKNPGIGPGKVARLLGIHYSHSGSDLTQPDRSAPLSVWIEDRGYSPDPGEIIVSTRIGVDYAGTDALRPYRFQLKIS